MKEQAPVLHQCHRWAHRVLLSLFPSNSPPSTSTCFASFFLSLIPSFIFLYLRFLPFSYVYETGNLDDLKSKMSTQPLEKSPTVRLFEYIYTSMEGQETEREYKEKPAARLAIECQSFHHVSRPSQPNGALHTSFCARWKMAPTNITCTFTFCFVSLSLSLLLQHSKM